MSIVSYAATLGAAAVGGVFYAFSTFTMRGLDGTDPATAIAAMRGINAQAQISGPFLVLFLGSAVLTVAVAVPAAAAPSRPGSAYLLAGAVCALLALIVTIMFNVPLNNRLAALDPAQLSALDAAREWAAYQRPWTAWNHVRTAAPLVGAALMLAGIHLR